MDPVALRATTACAPQIAALGASTTDCAPGSQEAFDAACAA